MASARHRLVFTLTAQLYGRGSDNAHRVFSLKDQVGNLAIWGTIGANMVHLEEIRRRIESRGFPIRVECDCIAPRPDFAEQENHVWWVPETGYFKILD